ncbi:MAG: putative metal-dependent phosphoesterase, family [Nitrospirae bacterium]|nr:putative metal-dependent phosphoesterase, family [Nitrospirota bacterium]
MLKEFRADLHIHTCLSPCADLHMTPSAIVKIASEKGLDIIAVTDHNSAENIIGTKKAAEDTDLTVLAGMEVTSSEEVHILALFDDIENALKLQEIVYKNFMSERDYDGKLGEQVVVNENDEVVGFNKRLLISATSLTTQSIVHIIHSLGGLSIASHIDREGFGIISKLGFIPEDLKFDALEISPNTGKEKAEDLFRDYKTYQWVSSSDAHYIEDIGRKTTSFFIKEATLAEMRAAMKNTGGRRVEWG